MVRGFSFEFLNLFFFTDKMLVVKLLVREIRTHYLFLPSSLFFLFPSTTKWTLYKMVSMRRIRVSKLYGQIFLTFISLKREREMIYLIVSAVKCSFFILDYLCVYAWEHLRMICTSMLYEVPTSSEVIWNINWSCFLKQIKKSDSFCFLSSVVGWLWGISIYRFWRQILSHLGWIFFWVVRRSLKVQLVYWSHCYLIQRL